MKLSRPRRPHDSTRLMSIASCGAHPPPSRPCSKNCQGFSKCLRGRKRQILRCLPHVLWVGTLPAGIGAGLMQMLPWSDSEAEGATRINTIDTYLISLLIHHWTVLFAVAIGAFIVLVMARSAYMAGAYPLPDAERPASQGAPRS